MSQDVGFVNATKLATITSLTRKDALSASLSYDKIDWILLYLITSSRWGFARDGGMKHKWQVYGFVLSLSLCQSHSQIGNT